MTADPLHIGPDATVHTAVLLLRSRGRLVLPVLDDGQVVGIVDAVTLFMYQPDIVVSDVMGAPVHVTGEMPLSAAAGLMRAHCLPEMPVVDGDLIGVIKSADLLSAWAMPVDPLTHLPWQDSFRLRSSMQLDAGKELTLLFFDMDDFGALNKRFGHIIGDRALQAVASSIRDAMDPATDEACRYGGDEFVVSTTRLRPEAEAWAAIVRDTIGAADIEGMDGHMSVSVGVAGGLRRTERPGSHAPATLDDLINRASQASTQAKHEPGRISTLDDKRMIALLDVPAPEPEKTDRPARIRIQSVETCVEEGTLHADVRLEFGGVSHTGSADGSADDDLSVVLEAASRAIMRFLPARYSVAPVHVGEQALCDSARVVMAVVRLDGPQGRQNLVGVADGTTQPRRAIVKAILDALNRPLEALVQPLALVA